MNRKEIKQVKQVKQLKQVRQELEITDQLLLERQKVLDAIPPCPIHGSCIPHALEWIEQAKQNAEGGMV